LQKTKGREMKWGEGEKSDHSRQVCWQNGGHIWGVQVVKTKKTRKKKKKEKDEF